MDAMLEPSTVEWALFGGWGCAAIALAFSRFHPRWVFLLSCILVAPSLAYGMYLHGFLEMGGLLHVTSAGCIPLVLRWAMRRRWYRP